MNRFVPVAAAAIALLALAGCSSASTPVATHSSAASPSPSATEMTLAQAGTRYLEVVCPGNAFSTKLAADSAAGDLATVVADAAVGRDLYQKQAAAFDNVSMGWPKVIEDDLKVLRDSDLSEVSSLDTLSRATSVDEANAVSFAGSSDDSISAAAQRIRLRLNLSADTSSSCGQ